MDTKCNRKFEEMKKYIPFLESMIKRLENSSTETNPPQAQLDNIRSLRDLLLDKKKRFKLNCLLKCEQVLINLYAEGQQRDPGPKDEVFDKKATEKSDLNLVRKKLKSAKKESNQSKLVSATIPENKVTKNTIAKNANCQADSDKNDKNIYTFPAQGQVENSNKRMTRSISRNIHDKSLEQFNASPLKRTPRNKKQFIHDSESKDNDIEHANLLTLKSQELTSDNVNLNTEPQICVENNSGTQKKSATSHRGNEDNEQNDSLDNSFGIDDLETFSENIKSDLVIDNINDLITDLEHDIDSAKSAGLVNKGKSTIDNENKKEGSEHLTMETKRSSDIKSSEGDLTDNTVSGIDVDTRRNEAIVSTSGDDNSHENNVLNEVGIPLSQSSSSHTASAEVEKFLTILQDKSKFKELLSILEKSSNENENLKKKLEKLSEIEFDDEDTMSKNKNEKINDVKNNSNNIEDYPNDPPLRDKTKKDDKSNTKAFQSEIANTEDINDDSDSLQKNEEKIKSMLFNTLFKQSDSNEIVVNENSQVDIKRNTTNTANSKEELVNLSEDSKNTYQENDRITSEIITADSTKIAASNDHDKPKKSNTNDTEILEPQEMATGRGKKAKKHNCKLNTAKQRKRKTVTKSVPTKEKCLTRFDVANFRYEKSARKNPTELQKLQDDIKKLFPNEKDEILSTGATGIRTRRVAKPVDKTRNQNDEQTEAVFNNSQLFSQEPVVVFEKFINIKSSGEISLIDTSKKKRTMKRQKPPLESDSSLDTEDKFIKKSKLTKSSTNIKINFKAKIKENHEEIDPYTFDTELTNHLENTSYLENDIKSSAPESESAASLTSFGNMELLTEAKKKLNNKRVSKGWKAGIIKPKNKKKNVGGKNISKSSSCDAIESQSIVQAPVDCFTDITYCFVKRQSCYDCRLCTYRGTEIVKHYKKQHPHSEIPLSRMSSAVAKEAIEESKNLNFPVICKVSSKKYICRFCFEEFASKRVSLEAFFWHIVSAHTGEYNQLCSQCLNVTSCPFNQDIPLAPQKHTGQLLGYVCEKCNYTKLSLENLKSHVILRHNDENTGIHAINLSVMTKDCLNILLEKSQKKDIECRSRSPQSSQSNENCAESSDATEENYRKINEDKSVNVPKPCIQSKITYSTDELSNFDDTSYIKIKQEVNEGQDIPHISSDLQIDKHNQEASSKDQVEEGNVLNDIFDYPHFKIKYTDTGFMRYICCIKGNFHYQTPLLISLKKHVQLKHSEVWDGFCFMCKVIVTPQGVYHFKDCLQHFLDKHDNFPIFEEVFLEPNAPKNESDKVCNENLTASSSYIKVRPISELISQTLHISQPTAENRPALPIVESVVSLGSEIEKSSPSPSHPSREQTIIRKQYKYEEVQAATMSKKQCVILNDMMSNVKLVHVFKCAGRFCHFTTDSTEDALLHASTHTRVGGVDSLNCVYCNYDTSNNAIDLITHVFKIHGRCPYVCNLCFYRATTDQLVNAHIKRVHEKERNCQILHTSFNTGDNTDDEILSREEAVQFYLCTVGRGTDAACKYKAYTPEKYSNHFSSKHDSETEFSCFICPLKLSTASDLVAHIKIHGLKLYQCAWCVYGSNSEAGLLAHSSFNHPDKVPKAYLRVVTKKEGTNDIKELPLAILNKTEFASIEVVPQNLKENPVKVAETSIQLEKLISRPGLTIK